MRLQVLLTVGFSFLIGFWFVPAKLVSGQSPVTELVFSPKGSTVIVCSETGVDLKSWPELKTIKRLSAKTRIPNVASFSPSGKMLAIGGGAPAENGTVELFSWPEGKSVSVISQQDDSVMALTWLDEQRLVAASMDKSIHLLDTKTGKSLQVLQGHSRGVTCLSFLKRDNLLVSSGIDQSLRIWNLNDFKIVVSLNNHSKRVHQLAVRPQTEGLSMIASASEDRTVRFWQPKIGRMVRFVRLDSPPLDIEWTNDGTRIFASCKNGSVYLIDPEEVKVIKKFKLVKSWAFSLAVHKTALAFLVGGRGSELRSASFKDIGN